jgi:hypothetical protein
LKNALKLTDPDCAMIVDRLKHTCFVLLLNKVRPLHQQSTTPYNGSEKGDGPMGIVPLHPALTLWKQINPLPTSVGLGFSVCEVFF